MRRPVHEEPSDPCRSDDVPVALGAVHLDDEVAMELRRHRDGSSGVGLVVRDANGMTGFLQVAAELEADVTPPESDVNITDEQYFEDPVDIVFATDEPATIHYTLDGSTPTLDSPTIERRGVRDIALPLEISEQTVLRWFAVDPAGNAEAPSR